MVSTKHLSFSYQGGPVIAFPDILLERKTSLLVLGRSGKGKTTFLHLLAGLLRPKEGNIAIDHTNINTLSDRRLDRFRGKNIGLVFQKPYFLKALTVKENLLLARQLGSSTARNNEAMEILEILNIADKANKLPGELSVGEQQRASIARAVINKPALILADEPTSALDDENAFIVAELMEKTAMNSNASLIIVTHDNRLKEKFKNTLQL